MKRFKNLIFTQMFVLFCIYLHKAAPWHIVSGCDVVVWLGRTVDHPSGIVSPGSLRPPPRDVISYSRRFLIGRLVHVAQPAVSSQPGARRRAALLTTAAPGSAGRDGWCVAAGATMHLFSGVEYSVSAAFFAKKNLRGLRHAGVMFLGFGGSVGSRYDPPPPAVPSPQVEMF